MENIDTAAIEIQMIDGDQKADFPLWEVNKNRGIFEKFYRNSRFLIRS